MASFRKNFVLQNHATTAHTDEIYKACKNKKETARIPEGTEIPLFPRVTKLSPLIVYTKTAILSRQHTVNAKKVGAPDPEVAENSVAREYGYTYGRIITGFLGNVNTVVDDIFSKGVCKCFGGKPKI